MTDQPKSPVIVAHITFIECPHCDTPQFGFVTDPRGGKFTCDNCQLEYQVPEAAEVDFG